MAGTVRLEYHDKIAVITNDNVEKHNAFDDEMDRQLFEILGELKTRRDVRAVVWRGEGKSFSSGRDVAALGGGQVTLSHHELMRRGHEGILQMFDIDAPVIVAIQGWAIGGSFQRALLADIRIAAQGARFMLPEVGHGVIPDTGGVGRLYQMCGHGVVSDMVLTGRPMSAEEALSYGVISRIVAPEDLDSTAMAMATKIAASPTIAVKLARRVISHLADGEVRSSMADEMIFQTMLNKSADYAEFRGCSGRVPRPALHRELIHHERNHRSAGAPGHRSECATSGNVRWGCGDGDGWRNRAREGDRHRVRSSWRLDSARQSRHRSSRRRPGGDRSGRWEGATGVV